jgi:6-phosphogluconolactonase
MPAGETADRLSTAQILVEPSGRYVYVSNRGHHSIAIFAIDQATGRLTAVGHQPTGGQTPRNFQIDPEGRYLYAANQDSHSIVVFRIDPATGKLEPTGHQYEVGSPVCILFGT